MKKRILSVLVCLFAFTTVLSLGSCRQFPSEDAHLQTSSSSKGDSKVSSLNAKGEWRIVFNNERYGNVTVSRTSNGVMVASSIVNGSLKVTSDTTASYTGNIWDSAASKQYKEAYFNFDFGKKTCTITLGN